MITSQTPAAVNPVNLGAMTKKELLEYADEHGVDGVKGSMRKADIIAVIEG